MFTLILIFSSIAIAQTVTGRIEGVVRDPQNLPVPNVAVVVTNIGTGATLSVTTSDEGTFVAPLLPPGSYRVTAEVAGFKRFTTEGVVVQVATVSNVTIQLEVGQVSE